MNKDVLANYDIETPRLKLVCCNKEILEAIFEGDSSLAKVLNVSILTKWTEFGEPAFKFTYERILRGPACIKWWSYLPVLKKTKTLLGSCGYKGDPKNGVVEIGYEVAAPYRGMGLATEMAKALIRQAFESGEVDCVQAHTLAEINESGSVLIKCGMKKIEELEDPEDGKVWRWEIRREQNN